MAVQVRVLLFARAREFAGRESLELALEDGERLSGLVNVLGRRIPRLGEYLTSCRFAVNQEFRELDDVVPDGAEVAIIPPVSGGA